MRLVLVSFAVLALVFYEMSGGSDFKPPERPQLAEATTKPKPRAEPRVVQISLQKPVTNTPATLIAKPAVIKTAATNASAADTADAANTTTRLTQVRASLSQGLTLGSGGSQPAGLSLVSLELGASGLRAATPRPPEPEAEPAAIFEEPAADLREITGTRVNMRDGPGTIYPIIARLTIGEKVEVISESGTGWLRLRSLPGRQLGWISSSLVSKADG